jgi:hypothetical protein
MFLNFHHQADCLFLVLWSLSKLFSARLFLEKCPFLEVTSDEYSFKFPPTT